MRSAGRLPRHRSGKSHGHGNARVLMVLRYIQCSAGDCVVLTHIYAGGGTKLYKKEMPLAVGGSSRGAQSR